MRYVWMMVSDDEYEFPIACAETVEELARITGKKAHIIRNAVSKYEHGRIAHSIYKRVRIEDE